MSPKKGGLNKGRGLDALIGGGSRRKEASDAESAVDNKEIAVESKKKGTNASDSAQKKGKAAKSAKTEKTTKTDKVTKSGSKEKTPEPTAKKKSTAKTNIAKTSNAKKSSTKTSTAKKSTAKKADTKKKAVEQEKTAAEDINIMEEQTRDVLETAAEEENNPVMPDKETSEKTALSIESDGQIEDNDSDPTEIGEISDDAENTSRESDEVIDDADEAFVDADETSVEEDETSVEADEFSVEANETHAGSDELSDIGYEQQERSAEKQIDTEEPVPLSPETEVRISLIIPNSEQPRREFDEASLEELAESIKIHGVLQPLLVQKKGKYYEIVAGERRWRAAKLVGLKTVPVIIRDYTPRQTLEISLIENIQRQDLNPIDEAFAYKRLLEEFSLKQAEVAKRVSKSRATITNSLRLLKLDERVQRMLIDNIMSTGHARALLAIEDGDLQFEIANRIATEGLNVRDTEKLISNLRKQPVKRERHDNVQIESIYAPFEEQLKQSLGTKVSIHPKRSGHGTIEIEYYSGEDLERLLDLLGRTGEELI